MQTVQRARGDVPDAAMVVLAPDGDEPVSVGGEADGSYVAVVQALEQVELLERPGVPETDGLVFGAGRDRRERALCVLSLGRLFVHKSLRDTLVEREDAVDVPDFRRFHM